MRCSTMLIVAASVLSLSSVAARADRTAADACAAKLPANAKLIYSAVIGDVTPKADLKGIVTSKTRSLVFAGKLSRGEARGAAEAAGACLKQAL